MKSELAPLVLHRVPCVVAALIAHDDVGHLAQQIGDFALAFVAPLGTHYYENRHDASRSILTLKLP